MRATAARSTWAWLAVLLLAIGAIVWQVARPTAPVAHADAGDHSEAAAPLVTVAEANWSALELLGPDGLTRIERSLRADPARLTACGLDRPEWIVLIHAADARPLATIEVGQLAPDRLSRYVRLPIDGRVLMLPNYQIEGLVGLAGAASTAPLSASAATR